MAHAKYHGLDEWTVDLDDGRRLILGPDDTVVVPCKDFADVPTNSLGNATKYYISSIDATNFVITVDTDPGATTATFAWSVRRDP